MGHCFWQVDNGPVTGVFFTVCRLLDVQKTVPLASLFLGDFAGIAYARNISETLQLSQLCWWWQKIQTHLFGKTWPN